MGGGWTLVGRAEELDLLRTALASTDVRGVVLSGAPGVGKTRLAAELVAHAGEQGWATEWTCGTRSMAGVPFGAFAHLVPTLEAARGPLAVMVRASGELRRRRGERALVLGVDDAHLLDEASAGLMHLLAASAEAFVVATVRRGEPAPGSVRALWKDDLAERIELQPLSRIEVTELLTAVLGGPVDTGTAHRLAEVSAGNVLFVRELVLLGREQGALARRHGVWTWRGELAAGARLTELVEERLAGLNRQQRAAVEVLAVGEPLPTELFRAVAGTRAVQALDSKELIVVTTDDRRSSVQLTHPLYGEALRAGIGSLRRQAVCRQLADALAATGAHRRDDVLRLSRWQLDGGGSADPATLVAAASRAESLFDHPLAERLARAAVAAGAGVEAEVALARALYWQSRHQEAQAVLDALDVAAAEPAARAECALVAAANAFWGLDDAARAEAVLVAAEAELPPGSERDKLTAQRSSVLLFNGRPHEAFAAVESVLEHPATDSEARFRAAIAGVSALATLGRPTRAVELAEQVLRSDPGMREERPLLLGELLAAQSAAFFQAGRYEEMHALSTRVYDRTASVKAHDLRGMWAMLLGRAALARGLAGTARERLREAAAALWEHDLSGMLPWALACWARAAALLGELGEAGTMLGESLRCQSGAVRVFDVELLAARAWVAAARGQQTEARRLARAAAEHAAATGQRCAELEAWHDALRLGEPGVLGRITALYEGSEHRLAAGYVAHAAALLGGDGAALDRCAEHFTELGLPLLAAEAAAEAAEQHDRDGRRGPQLAALARVREAQRRCEGALTPALRRVAEPPTMSSLTSREREIAELAGRGCSNREIAEALVLSLRTVGNHLNHVYGKLGITGRTELNTVLELHDPVRT